MRIWHGPATVTGELTLISRHCRRATAGRPGELRSGSQETGLSPALTRMGRGTLKEEFVEGNSLGRRISLGEMPLWSWTIVVLLLAALFILLSASGELLAPLFGQAAGVADYLHEFAHDGRHLLSVPCH